MARAPLFLAVLLSSCAAIPVQPTKTTVEIVLPSPDGLRHMTIYGAIDQFTTLGVVADLASADAEGAKEVVLDINSPGGSVVAGFQVMIALIKSEHAGLTVNCRIGDRAMAASMAGIIFEGACSHRSMAPSAQLMFHEPAMPSDGGKERDFRHDADALSDLNMRIATMISWQFHDPDGTPWSAKRYARWIAGRDRWVDAVGALAMGATDAVE